MTKCLCNIFLYLVKVKLIVSLSKDANEVGISIFNHAAYKNTKSKWEKLRRIAKEEAKAAKIAKAERMAKREADMNA